jgi:UV DNA damage endonuclease
MKSSKSQRNKHSHKGLELPPLPQLGLVCITTSEHIRFRTITRKRLLSLSADEQMTALRQLYLDNTNRLRAGLDFLVAQNIKLYRLTSALFPFADDPLGIDLLEELREPLAAIGQRIAELGIRLVLHPDQFVVLNSDSPHVIANSQKILTMHARIFDLLQQPRSAWAAFNIHGGKGDRVERLVKVIGELPDEIRLRLTLENDEHAYGAEQMIEVCHAAGVPMVFDAHHHVVREKLASYDDPSVGAMLAATRTTWPVPEWQLVHISNGRESFNDARHSDFITLMPASFNSTIWIEVEAKLKEEAINQLRREWPPQLASAVSG